MVFNGRKEKTTGGLTKDSLMRNKRGKIVSKKASANGKVSFRKIEPWLDAVMEAREALHTKGFVAINGKSLHGQALYVKAKGIRNERRRSSGMGVQGTPAASVSSPLISKTPHGTPG